MRRPLRELPPAAILLATAVTYVIWCRFTRSPPHPNYDTYAYFYPNTVYALRSLADGSGFLWNRFQDCGQPALAIPSWGMLYPLRILYAMFDMDTALVLETALHLFIGGLGTYLCCRQWNVSSWAALAGAFVFELGAVTIFLASWNPLIIGPYAWLPACMAACERALKEPAARNGALLGVVLTLQLLPGYPQISLMTYQLIGLRVLWQLAVERPRRIWRTLTAIGFGLLLPPFLAAAQFVPSLEFISASIRGRELTSEELRMPQLAMTWVRWRSLLEMRLSYGAMFPVVPLFVASFAFGSKAHRRIALFYLLAGALFFTLAFDNFVYDLYRHLPLVTIFRLPHRFLWVSALSLPLLVGLGADVLERAVRQGNVIRTTSLGLSVAALWFAVLYFHGLVANEWWMLAAAACSVALVLVSTRTSSLGRVSLAVLILASTALVVRAPAFWLLRDSSLLYDRSAEFDFVKQHLTLQDRIYPFGRHGDYTLTHKTPSLMYVPSISDYEPQASQRYAELFTMLMLNRPMRSMNEFYYRLSSIPRNAPLLNLLATRLLLVASPGPAFIGSPKPTLELLERQGDLRIFENTSALPRAFFVPTARIIQKPEEVLRRLSSPNHHPREVVLLEHEPADGFLGEPGGKGEVNILYDRSEELAIRVRATKGGFLFLSDQDYPGWKAEVNGERAEIERANYAFRAVRVPAGESTVVFRYRPASIWIGTFVSVLTAFLLVVTLGTSWLRHRKGPAQDLAAGQGTATV